MHAASVFWYLCKWRDGSKMNFHDRESGTANGNKTARRSGTMVKPKCGGEGGEYFRPTSSTFLLVRFFMVTFIRGVHLAKRWPSMIKEVLPEMWSKDDNVFTILRYVTGKMELFLLMVLFLPSRVSGNWTSTVASLEIVSIFRIGKIGWVFKTRLDASRFHLDTLLRCRWRWLVLLFAAESVRWWKNGKCVFFLSCVRYVRGGLAGMGNSYF